MPNQNDQTQTPQHGSAGGNTWRDRFKAFWKDPWVSLTRVDYDSNKLTGWREKAFLLYNVIVTLVSAYLLIDYTASSPCLYVPRPEDQASTSPTDAQVPRACASLPTTAEDVLDDTLWAVLSAGAAGGVLCNLRGIFRWYRDEGGFRRGFVWPFVVRPFMGALVGLLVFFVVNFFNSALALDPSALGWQHLAGRLSYIGLAIISGFGSQEFMERMKEVARTTFAEGGGPQVLTSSLVAAWSGDAANLKGPDSIEPVGADELILVIGNVLNDNESARWRLFHPGEAVAKPKGQAIAIKFAGGTPAERVKAANDWVNQMLSSQGKSDQKNALEAANWNV